MFFWNSLAFSTIQVILLSYKKEQTIDTMGHKGIMLSEKKLENFRKTLTSALLTMPKTLTVWITINCGKFFKKWEYQTT